MGNQRDLNCDNRLQISHFFHKHLFFSCGVQANLGFKGFIMRIFTVISFLVLSYDLRRTCEPVKLSNTRDESDGNHIQDDSSDGVTTGRVSRDVGSALFNIYPAQVDLTEWTRRFEEKFGDLTKLVDRRFNTLDSLVKGLEERFDAMDRRQNKTDLLTATRFEEVKEKI